MVDEKPVDVPGRHVTIVHGAQRQADNTVAVVMTLDNREMFALILDRERAEQAVEVLIAALPPASDGELAMLVAEQAGTVQIDDIEVADLHDPDRREPSHPFSIRMKTGETTMLELRMSHREVVRWHRRLGAQIQQYVKRHGH